MKNIAIIPARSGSKGLVDKNIKMFDGKPLMAYSIEAAIASGLFDVIHVSTDSERYAEIARKYGADVPFLRSEEMSSDTADSWDAVNEVLERYEDAGSHFETLTLLQPTSPLRNAQDICSAFEIMSDKKANAVISVCEADHPPMWFHPLKADGAMTYFAESTDEGRQRQAFETQYRMNGAIYLIKMDYFKAVRHNILRDKAFAYIMDKRTSIDIDDQFDFEVAEAIFMNGQNREAL